MRVFRALFLLGLVGTANAGTNVSIQRSTIDSEITVNQRFDAYDYGLLGTKDQGLFTIGKYFPIAGGVEAHASFGLGYNWQEKGVAVRMQHDIRVPFVVPQSRFLVGAVSSNNSANFVNPIMGYEYSF